MTRHRACSVAELNRQGRLIVDVGGREVGLFLVDGQVFALRNRCPHQGARVCLGSVSGSNLPSPVYEFDYGLADRVLRCPWHAWEFDITTGRSLFDPAVRIKSYDVEIDGDDVVLVL